MKETLEAKTSDEKKHCWEGLNEYILDGHEDFLNFTEIGIEGTTNILKKMKPNQYFVATSRSLTRNNYRELSLSESQLNANAIKYFENYLAKLKSIGLEIGKGESEYGYKMPLPKKGDDIRKLIIFRRKIKE